MEAGLRLSRLHSPVALHLAASLHVPVIVNGVRTSVLLNEIEVITVDLTVDIERTDSILTLTVNPVKIDNHRQFHVVSLARLLVEAEPSARVCRISRNGDCVNFSHLHIFLSEKGLVKGSTLGTTFVSTPQDKKNCTENKSENSSAYCTDHRYCTLGFSAAVAIDGAAIRTGCTVAVACVARIIYIGVVIVVAWGYIVGWGNVVSRLGVSVRVGVSIGVPSCLQIHAI